MVDSFTMTVTHSGGSGQVDGQNAVTVASDTGYDPVWDATVAVAATTQGLLLSGDWQVIARSVYAALSWPGTAAIVWEDGTVWDYYLQETGSASDTLNPSSYGLAYQSVKLTPPGLSQRFKVVQSADHNTRVSLNIAIGSLAAEVTGIGTAVDACTRDGMPLAVGGAATVFNPSGGSIDYITPGAETPPGGALHNAYLQPTEDYLWMRNENGVARMSAPIRGIGKVKVADGYGGQVDLGLTATSITGAS